MRLGFLCILIALSAASAGCNAILGNERYDLADGGDDASSSDATADATTRVDGGKHEAGARDAASEESMVTVDGGEGEGGEDDSGCGSLADIHSCGACTNDCTQFPHVSPTGIGCAGGQCSYACATGYADCADAGTGCGTTLSSSSTCGACGVSCGTATPVCAPSDAGVYACAGGCTAGETNCSNTCANLMTDATHCGTCATACPSSQVCKGGSCQCPTTAQPDACGTACTSKQTDSANCGSCGHACSGGETCQAGLCACPAGTKLCGGACVNVLGTDVNNCGACGTSCSKLPHVGTTGLACTAGKCSYSCAAGFADCGNTGTGCNTSLGTATNCTGCGAGCSGATPVCSPSGSTYACTNGCTTGQTNCSGTCTTLVSDPSHCGTCATVCAASEACQSGTCVCPTTANPNFCGTACTNTQTDTANCGTCTHACPSVQACKAGACACPSTTNPTLCGSVCTNTMSDSNNCGTCTHACPAAETCQGGTCACPTTANPNFCGTACTNTKTDSNNCSSCGAACGGGQQCVNSACQCPTNTIMCNGTCQTANICGGCGTITQTLGGACGTCGTYVCNAGKTALTCNDPGTTNSCPTWCSSQPAPSGVAAADYQCVDFDNGLPSTSTWAQTVAGSGALGRATSQFDSSPASLMTSVTANSADTAAITWSAGGSTNISSISVSMAVNPVTPPAVVPPSDELDLLIIKAGATSIYLYYVEESSFQTNYTGLGLRWVFAPSAAIGDNCVLNTTLNNNMWNQVQLTATAATQVISVTLNGANVSCPCCSSVGIDQSVSATVDVGATSNVIGGTTFSWTGYYDNIQATIRR